MTWEKNQTLVSLPAAADLTAYQYRAVVIGSDGTVNLPKTDVTQIALGILQNAPDEGEEAVVAVAPGVSKAQAGEALDAGVLVGPEWVDDNGDSGKVIATVATAYTLGLTLSAGAEDNLVTVLLGNIAVIT
jgi:hypothetical protein